jgi:Zn-dependent protease with chaperone function
LLGPVAVAILAWARALRPVRRGGRPAFFAFAQQAPWIGLLALLAWVPTALQRVPLAVTPRVLPPGLFMPAFGLALLGPPLATMCLLGLLVHDVARRAGLTEWTWRDAIGDALLMLVGGLSPIVLLLSAIDAVRVALFREATLATIAGVMIAVAAATVRRRKSGLTLHAVSSGELRDRVFDLAGRAGVRLQQLYVVPFRRLRMANAFAVQGNVVTLTDLLLRELDRDEVGAILAHEMAHLARRDPSKLALILVASLAVPMATATIGGYAPAAVVLAACLTAQLALRRRIEYAADARALTLGVRPEALVTGLVRLHQLSQIPVRWSRLCEAFLTHPSSERRALRIAQLARLDPNAVASWLEAPPAAGPRYAVPPSLEVPRAFGTRFRRRVIVRLTWTLLAAAAMVPALVIAVLGPFGPVPRPAGVALAALAGLAAWVTIWALGTRGSIRTLERSIARRLGVHDRTTGQRCFVGLSPGPTPRLYEGFSAWDAGFLTLQPGRLDYVGEEASFSLSAQEVSRVWVDDGLPGWIRLHAVRLAWTRADGTSGTLGLVPLGMGSAFAARAAVGRLRDALETWHAGPQGAPLGDRLGPPPTHEVTSASPRDALKPRLVLTTLVVLGVLTLGAAFLVGLPLDPFVRGWPDASLASSIVFLLALAPVLTWREPKGSEDSAGEARRAA